MSGNNPYAALFEQVKIGPVTARNRFFQVPHCCGMGHLRPQAHAAMRAMKAEGGWAVVSTEETEIHPSSDLSPYAEQRLWDEQDIPALQLMTDAVHQRGALAAIELVHNGNHAPNLLSRAPAFAPSDMSIDTLYPKQARAMSKADIKEFRAWHRAAARRAKDAGFDVIYVYAGHRMALTQHFLLPEYNTRTDEYGGCLENRVRLIRELIEETKEEVGDSCGVAFRFAVDEMMGKDGMQAHEEGRAVVEMLAELPDLWDVNVSDWSNDSATTRHVPEDGYQTPYIEFVKQVTSKPVVAVGRLSSPDTMLSLVNRGIVDFIGAARPSISDPFLPNKIEENRIDEIRECIGCNICVSSDNLGVPIRCTQNPTMGEEWRRDWHPEKIEPKGTEESALVVGGGPTGLECAMQLARRGYNVTLAESDQEFGGRVLAESQLKGLSAWRRVIDYRLHDLQQRANVSLFANSVLGVDEITELGITNVFIATGSTWRRDGIGRSSRTALETDDSIRILTPDDFNNGSAEYSGPILIYDDDQAYLAGVLAEHLAEMGAEVIFVTPASTVSPWTELTLEQYKIQRSLIQAGVKILCNQKLQSIRAKQCILSCAYSEQTQQLDCGAVLLVTERTRNDQLYRQLLAYQTEEKIQLNHIELLGDAATPGLIADAVFAGHLAARNFERSPEAIKQQFFVREIVSLQDTRKL